MRGYHAQTKGPPQRNKAQSTHTHVPLSLACLVSTFLRLAAPPAPFVFLAHPPLPEPTAHLPPAPKTLEGRRGEAHFACPIRASKGRCTTTQHTRLGAKTPGETRPSNPWPFGCCGGGVLPFSSSHQHTHISLLSMDTPLLPTFYPHLEPFSPTLFPNCPTPDTHTTSASSRTWGGGLGRGKAAAVAPKSRPLLGLCPLRATISPPSSIQASLQASSLAAQAQPRCAVCVECAGVLLSK